MKLKMPARIALVFSILLVMVSVYFIFLDSSGSINPLARDFSLGRIDNITEIHITDAKQSITLTKSKTGWLADGEFLVKDQLPELFLTTINDIGIKEPASKAQRSQLQEQLLNSKHIEVFKSQRKICSYYILFDSANTQETFLMKKWAKLPLEAEIPGLKIPVASLYHCDLAYWKAKYVIPISAENIDWVSFDNQALPLQSFKLERLNAKEIVLTTPSSPIATQKIDQIAASDFIASLPRMQYIKEVDSTDSLDIQSISLQAAVYTIKIGYAHTRQAELKFYAYIKNTRSGIVKNPDIFIGICSLSKLTFIGRFVDFDPVIRNPEYFLNK